MAKSADLKPLQLLLASKRGRSLPLSPRLTRLYGTFRMPAAGPRRAEGGLERGQGREARLVGQRLQSSGSGVE